MFNWLKFYIVLLMATSLSTQASTIVLVDNGASNYRIVIPNNATAIERKSASVLNQYLLEISGVNLVVVSDEEPLKEKEILIGQTNRKVAQPYPSLKNEGLRIETKGTHLILQGEGKGTLYAVYTFLEQFLGCRKYTASFKVVPKKQSIKLPTIKLVENPLLAFRSVYYPDPETDQEYLDWHKLHRIDNEWGLWGHSFDKLVPAGKYFATHPAYFGLVDGKRKPMQLCMSNSEVLAIATEQMKQMIEANPSAKYWSLSQNDDNGYCECEQCSKLNQKHGSPQGALLSFVNKVAEEFPKQQFTTLAYGWSRKPPIGLKPAKNVSIFLANIEVNRSKTFSSDPRSASFRTDYEGWLKLSKNIILWDYTTQFTNFISPFPNYNTLNPNLSYFLKDKPEGIFMQGSGYSPAEFSELKTYVIAKKLWNNSIDLSKATDEFMQAYYGKAAPFLKQYMQLMEAESQKSNARLDIYDNPIKPYKTYLTIDLIAKYGQLLRQALQAVKGDATFYTRVEKEVLPLNYTVLQQARFYGLEPNGVFRLTSNGYEIRQGIAQQVDEFELALANCGIKQLNEDGLTVSAYIKQWKKLLATGPRIHKALNKKVTLLTPSDEEFAGKGARTLIDGNWGNLDFQYNWLGWYGKNMSVLVDLGEATPIAQVELAFLDNQRHGMFLPKRIVVELATDEKNFEEIASIDNPAPEENYVSEVRPFKFSFKKTKARFVKVTAYNLDQLPEWKINKNKKPWLLTDEIIIN